LNLRHDALSLTIAGDFIEDSFMGKREIRDVFLARINKPAQDSAWKISYVGVVKGHEKVDLLQIILKILQKRPTQSRVKT